MIAGPARWELTSERMRLRRLTDADGDWLAGLHGDAAVMRYIDDGRPVRREVVLAETIPRILAGYAAPGSAPGPLAAIAGPGPGPGGEPGQAPRAGQAVLGWFALSPASSVGLENEPDDSLELGYRLFPAAWGRGYGTEGARALVKHAFTDLGTPRGGATTMTVNAGSRRVLEKAGLSLVRTFFAEWPGYLDGAEHGDVVYAADRAGWLRAARTAGW